MTASRDLQIRETRWPRQSSPFATNPLLREVRPPPPHVYGEANAGFRSETPRAGVDSAQLQPRPLPARTLQPTSRWSPPTTRTIQPIRTQIPHCGFDASSDTLSLHAGKTRRADRNSNAYRARRLPDAWHARVRYVQVPDIYFTLGSLPVPRNADATVTTSPAALPSPATSSSPTLTRPPSQRMTSCGTRSIALNAAFATANATTV